MSPDNTILQPNELPDQPVIVNSYIPSQVIDLALSSPELGIGELVALDPQDK